MLRRIVIWLAAPVMALASADTDWQQIVAMDAGPGKTPRSREEALQIARVHFANHRRIIEAFIAANPNDPRVFDAKMRLAAILAATGEMEGKQQPVDDAMRQYAELEKDASATREQRANAGFRRVSLYLQSLRERIPEMRPALVDAARNFVVKYPGDRRGPRLLVEVASVCDNDPQLKRRLLEQARSLTSEDALRRRIADDLKRLDRLDRVMELKFPTIQGGTFDSAALKGNVVVLVFWSAESPHSLLWFPKLLRGLGDLPKENFRVATVALDSNRTEVLRRMKELGIEDWPTHFDGNGWENAIARPLGINELPTVFIIDRTGKLRAANARDNADIWVRRLLRE